MIEIRQAEHSDETWYVASESGAREYSVHHKFHPLVGGFIWTCNCMDFTERRQWHGETCKHIDQVKPFGRPIPHSDEKIAAKFGNGNWRQPYRNPDAYRVQSKLETALESLQALLEEIRR